MTSRYGGTVVARNLFQYDKYPNQVWNPITAQQHAELSRTLENLVLVVDHDLISLSTISSMLAKFNFKVLRFQTAAEAINSLERGVVKGEELDLVVAEVHPANTDTLVVFHHVMESLRVPFVTMCTYDDVEAVSERMTLGSCVNVLKPFGTETVNILLHKALQHKSRRALPEGSSILKKTQGRMDSSSTKNHGSETEEDEELDVFKAHGHSKNLHRFIWSRKLHEKFLRAVEELGEFATPSKIRWHINVKNLTLEHISSHLQKHRLREQKAKQEKEDYQRHPNMNKLAELITSAHNAASPSPINHLTTTQKQITHGVTSATWDKHPGKLRAHMEERSGEAEVFKTNAPASAVLKSHATSVWDKYEESLQCFDESLPKRTSMTYRSSLLSVKSKAIAESGDIANIIPTVAAIETGYGAPASVPLESSGLTNPFHQLQDTSRTEAAGNNANLVGVTQACYNMNQVHLAINLQEDTMNQVNNAVAPDGNTMSGVHASAMVADGVLDLEGKALLDGTCSSCSTAEKMPYGISSWEEVETFLMSQLEGEEQEGIEPDDMLQVDDAWKQALQPANGDDAPVAQTDDVPAAQEPSTGDALAYDPGFSIDDVQVWSPQFAGDVYGMPF